MKFKKLLSKLEKVKADVPTRFWYPSLQGDFYLDIAGHFMFCKKGENSFSPYTFTLADFRRTDWEMVSR